jgi:hypothetical protein
MKKNPFETDYEKKFIENLQKAEIDYSKIVASKKLK